MNSKRVKNPIQELFNEFFEGVASSVTERELKPRPDPFGPAQSPKVEKTGIFGMEIGDVETPYHWDVFYKGIKFLSTPSLESACARLQKLIELDE